MKIHHSQFTNKEMTYDIRLEIITCKVCGSKVKRYNWLKHLKTKTHKKKAKAEDLTHLAGVMETMLET